MNRTALLVPVTLLLLIEACAAPEPGRLDKADSADTSEESATTAPTAKKTKVHTSLTGDSDPANMGDESSVPSSTPSLGTIKVNFKGKLIGDDKNADEFHGIFRSCSSQGSMTSRATFIDATAITLVGVNAPHTVIRADIASLSDTKRTFSETGALEIPIDPSALTKEPTVYAIVGEGDGFGSPQKCGYDMKPPTSADVEDFPEKCGIVGYLTAYYDGSNVYAKPMTQFLWAANERKKDESDFSISKDNYGCDLYDSPLVLDLGGRGVSLAAPAGDVFDIDGDGTRDRLAWVSSENTPFLVRDANGNGIVDGIDELFGNRTRGPLGLASSANGFEALAAWDSSADGTIDAKDPVWASLRLWFDRNHDGRTDAGELETLGSRGITSIAASYVTVSEDLSSGGRLEGAVLERGAATSSDGRMIPVVDVWFKR